MRVWKLISVALVMAATGAAWAETVPSFPVLGDKVGEYSAVHIYTRDRDQSTGYLVTVDGTYTRATPVSAFAGPGVITAFSTPDQMLMAREGGVGTESQWGIFAVRIMEAGDTQVPSDIFKQVVPPGDLTYEWTDTNIITGDTCLVGVFYDGWDSLVTINGNQLTTETQDIKFQLWAVDKAQVNLAGASQGPGYDANFRTARDRYTDWVEGTGTLLLSGISTFQRFIGTQTGLGPFLFDGQTVVYFDVSPDANFGIWNPLIAGGNYFTDPLGNIADIKMTYDIDPGTDGWALNSHDDGGLLVQGIPEPLTMAGLFLGVGGVGRYIRRRMKAA